MTYGTLSLVHKISGITSSSISSQSSFTASIQTHYKYTATLACLTIQIQSMIAEPHSLESPKTELAIPAMVELNCALIGTGINLVKLLPASNDDHGGVIVDMREPVEPDFFLTMLRASMLLWRQQEKKGVWIKLPIELVNLVETAVKEGFCYHHAEPSYLMLVYWIPETASTIPANASHRVRIGAIVWNDKREEKIGIFRGAGVWKIPTGVVDEGEDIFMAATREVKEETGIDTEFQEILAFRQSHKSFFGKSDLFFLCFLHPKSFDIQKQESEIEAAQWMPLEEYAAQPFAKKHELFKYIDDLCLAKVDRNYAGFSPLPTTSIFNDRISYLYSNIRGLKLTSPADHQQKTA